MPAEIGSVVVGLILLYFGADGLVKGASGLALRLGIAPLIVGLTVVAYGTSAPEMVVSLKASQAGQGGLALGNVVGSNIFNIAFILGLCALVRPTTADSQIVRREIPIMVALSVLLLVLLQDRHLSRGDAGILAATLLGYTLYNVLQARRQQQDRLAQEFAEELPTAPASYPKLGILVVVGLLLLIAGGRLFVDGAVGLARRFGMSEAVIGLTIVAAGTSLPELATSLIAAFRRQADIAIGNVVGSNIFNISGILGISGLISPMDGAGLSAVDLWVMLGTAIALFPVLKTGLSVNRWEGGFLFVAYAAYVYHLLPKA